MINSVDAVYERFCVAKNKYCLVFLSLNRAAKLKNEMNEVITENVASEMHRESFESFLHENVVGTLKTEKKKQCERTYATSNAKEKLGQKTANK